MACQRRIVKCPRNADQLSSINCANQGDPQRLSDSDTSEIITIYSCKLTNSTPRSYRAKCNKRIELNVEVGKSLTHFWDSPVAGWLTCGAVRLQHPRAETSERTKVNRPIRCFALLLKPQRATLSWLCPINPAIRRHTDTTLQFTT